MKASEPTSASVLKALETCELVGEEAFVARVSSGNGWRSHIIVHEGRSYPLKAIWADAFQPTISPRHFNTKDAVKGLQSLGFDCFKLISER